jgi:hypothetical protein
VKHNKKGRSSTPRIKSVNSGYHPSYINPRNNELDWLNEYNIYEYHQELQELGQKKTHPIMVLPEDSPVETGLKEQAQVLNESMQQYMDSVQLEARIPKSVYEYFQKNNLNLAHVFKESLITSMLLSQNQDFFDELKVEIIVDTNGFSE